MVQYRMKNSGEHGAESNNTTIIVILSATLFFHAYRTSGLYLQKMNQMQLREEESNW